MDIKVAPFPLNIKAFTTQAPLSFREGTTEGEVAKRELEAKLQPEMPIKWLLQVHGDTILELPLTSAVAPADAVFTRKKGIACVVRTADCLPILISSKRGDIIAAVHAGWRGLHAEIIKKTVETMCYVPSELVVWIGPGICQQHFEVGEEVFEQFVSLNSANRSLFIKNNNTKYQADLYGIARLQLRDLGIPMENITGGDICTFESPNLHSHRRDGEKAGRMASCIMIT